jgi:ATP-binding cassette, subfamily C, bacterial LapB
MTTVKQQPNAFSYFVEAIFKRKRVFIEAMVGTFVVNLIGLTTSLYSMQVYDRVIPTNGLQTLWVLTTGVALAIALELIMKQVRALMVDRACKSIDVELSDFFFGRALRIRLDRRPRSIGTFAAQVRMFESVRTFLTSTTLFVLADIPFAILFVGVIAWIAGPVALVPLLLLPVSLVTGLVFIKPIERLTNENVMESTLKNGLLIESIDGVETIKTLSAETSFLQRWHALTMKMGDSELSLKSLSGLSGSLTQAIQQVSYVGMVAAGVYAITSGNLTMGGLIACSIISGRALTPIAQISSLLVQWQHAKAALKGLDAILKMPADGEMEHGQPVKPEKCNMDLRLEEVHFAYEMQHEAVQVAALQIKPGERVAIIGSVGSGKSTLLKLLSGLYQPSKGRVFLDGVDLAHMDTDFVRSNIHYLPQDARLFNGTLRENLVLGMDEPGDDAILRACKATGVDRIIAQHPRGLGLMIAEGGQGLSGGQRQLVTITRLLLSTRGVLLLDEPTASIDGPLEEQVARALFESVQPTDTVVMVTHKTSLLRFVNRIIVMDRGKVLLDGPRDAVLARIMQKPQADKASLTQPTANAGAATNAA